MKSFRSSVFKCTLFINWINNVNKMDVYFT